MTDRTIEEWAEYYDNEYKTKSRFRMKDWRQAALKKWLEIRNEMDFGSGDYLDVGCGRGESLEIAKPFFEGVQGCEIAESCCGPRNVWHLKEGAKKLPYMSKHFDAVTVLDVLEHVIPADLNETIREIWRVTKTDLLVGVPGPRKKDPEGHLTREDQGWWLDRLSDMVGPDNLIVTLDLGDDPNDSPANPKPYYWFHIVRGE